MRIKRRPVWLNCSECHKPCDEPCPAGCCERNRKRLMRVQADAALDSCTETVQKLHRCTIKKARFKCYEC
jgi:hypothetical protein